MNKACTVVIFLLAGAAVASANSIVFVVDLTGISGGSVMGTIETDGKVGTLAQSDILDWNLLLKDGTTTYDLKGPLSGNNSTVDLSGTDLSEELTPSNELFYNFGGNGFILFEADSPGTEYFCAETTTGGCGVADAEELFINSTDGPKEVTVSGQQVIGTPEPGTLGLLAFGACAFWRYRRKSTTR